MIMSDAIMTVGWHPRLSIRHRYAARARCRRNADTMRGEDAKHRVSTGEAVWPYPAGAGAYAEGGVSGRAMRVAEA
jgi:hypothetical protein